MAVDLTARLKEQGMKQESGDDLTRYVRPADVVRTASVSKTTVMEAIWSGKLEAYRVGRAWLIPADAVDQWIKGIEVAA